MASQILVNAQYYFFVNLNCIIMISISHLTLAQSSVIVFFRCQCETIINLYIYYQLLARLKYISTGTIVLILDFSFICNNIIQPQLMVRHSSESLSLQRTPTCTITYMCVYIHVRTHTCVNTHMCEHLHVGTPTSWNTYVCKYLVRTPTRAYTCMFVHIHVRTPSCVNTFMCEHLHE